MNQTKDNLIEKKLCLTQKDWNRIQDLGINIPEGNFSMKHIIHRLNYNELLKIISNSERYSLALKCLNSIGMTIIPGESGFLIDICDNDKLYDFIEYLKKHLAYSKDCKQELNEYANNLVNNNKAIIVKS